MSTLVLKRTTSNDPDFKALVVELDKDLKIRDGEEHSFYAQFNGIDTIKQVVVGYINQLPAGCGAVKEYNAETMEVKRMFVPLSQRGKGIASQVLVELEAWCKELGYKECVLETGFKQPEAIALYKRNGYHIIPNYGQYVGVENSICFNKLLTP